MGKRTIRFVAALRLLSITIQGDLSTTAGGVRFDKIARFETGKRLLSCWNWARQGGMPTPHVAPDLLGAADAKCEGETPPDASDRELKAVQDFTPNMARRSALLNRFDNLDIPDWAVRREADTVSSFESPLTFGYYASATYHSVLRRIQSLLME